MASSGFACMALHITIHCREGAWSKDLGRVRHIPEPNRSSGRLGQT